MTPSIVNLQDRFHAAVDTLVAINLERQVIYPYDSGFSFASYAAHHATVCVDAGVACGKTEYIRRRAGKGSLIIVRNASLGRDMFRGVEGADILSMNQVVNGSPRNGMAMAYDRVYIDDAGCTMRTQEQRRDMYDILALADGKQVFIQFGAHV